MSGDLTPAQQLILDQLSASDLSRDFYFSGGAALGAYYLNHRTSLDLDFFSRHRFDPKRVVRFLNDIAEGPMIPRRVQDRYEFTVPLRGERLRVEFVHYDFDRVSESGVAHGNLRVDSLRDIIANKLSAMIERVEAKDYADLYFLLQRPDVDLDQGIADCKRKFGWPGLRLLLQAAFLRVDKLRAWPETTPPTTLDQARTFFRDLARSLINLHDA